MERTVFAELNDYTATVIGIIRDERPFTDVLTADLVYVGAAGTGASPTRRPNNDHYRALEEQHGRPRQPDAARADGAVDAARRADRRRPTRPA